MKLFLVHCIFALALTLTGYLAEGRIFDRCGLVAELRRQGFPEDKMRDCEYLLILLGFPQFTFPSLFLVLSQAKKSSNFLAMRIIFTTDDW